MRKIYAQSFFNGNYFWKNESLFGLDFHSIGKINKAVSKQIEIKI